MKLEFLGAAHEVTGSCHYVQVGDKRFLVDGGMEQGPDLYVNASISVNASEIDYVFVTHAHIDHSGQLPLLYASGFHGKIYATTATTQLCDIMLRDSAHIQESEAEWQNRKASRSGDEKVKPIYTIQDVEALMPHFVSCPYDQKIRVCDEIEIRFRDAGHLLGSSFIEIWLTENGTEKKIIFSGDLGPGNRPLIRDPELPDTADYLVIESTYGNREHTSSPDYAVELAGVISRTFDRGGNLVIPAFSVGRTQEMLYHLKRVKTENMLPKYADFEVYVDSPLSNEATSIFNKNVKECFNETALEMVERGENPIQFEGLKKSITSDDSIAINSLEKPVVIISASGMCEAGRIRHHLKHNLWRPECTILFVGYQVPGTLGNRLLNGAESVKLFGETIKVRAEIVNLPGLSGHAGRSQLTSWVNAMDPKPQHIFVVHGEDQVCDEFAEHLHQELGCQATAPYSSDTYDLATDVCIAYGDRKRAQPKKKAAASGVFERLLAAAERLVALVRKSEGRTNKDMKKLTEKINNLCDEWEK